MKRVRFKESGNDIKKSVAEDEIKIVVHSKCTKELTDRFCGLIERGLPGDGCCDYLGISRTAFHVWIDKGSRYLDGGLEPAEWKVYGYFVNRYRKALAAYRLTITDDLHGRELLEKNKGWVRAITLLERRDRRNYGRGEPQGGNIQDYSPDDRFR
jgi:hypothetical protein